MNRSFLRIILAVGLSLVTGPAGAASIKVSSNGVDSGTCGTGANAPCLTIAQAVGNAVAGDSILVGAGRYVGTTVNKALRLWSSNGTGGAVIVSPMALSADGIVFGKPGKGFSLTVGAPNSAIIVMGNAVTVRGNRVYQSGIGVDATGNDAIVRDNSFDSCTTGIRIAGNGAQVRGNRSGYMGRSVLLDVTSTGADVRENRMLGPSGDGVTINGADHLVRRNFAHGTDTGFNNAGAPSGVTLLENTVVGALSLGYSLFDGSGWVLIGNAAYDGNQPGFYLQANSTFTLTGNVAIGNVSYGIFLGNGSGHTLKDNTAIHNEYGIFLGSAGAGVTISGGNLYGNTSSNCGLSNNTGTAVTANKVYWGAATGPGADPADALCNNIAMTTVTNPAAKANPIKAPPVK